MKICCFGAGAIGSYVGGSLGLIGNPLVYIEQPGFIPVLRENGVTIEDINGNKRHLKQFEIYPSIGEALEEHEFDLVIMAVKGFDTDAVLKTMLPYVDRMPPVLSLQNGVENEAKIAAVLGENKVIPCSVCTAISRGEGGAIRVARLRGIGLSGENPILPELLRECGEAGLKPKRLENARGMKWSKMISNLLSNAASAILNMTPAEVYADPVGFELEIRQLKETLAVMRAAGIEPINIPGVPLKALCLAVEHLPAPLARPIMSKAIGGGRGSKMPSFYIDLRAGKKQSEVEFLNGAVVREGERQNIPTPVNLLYYEVLTQMAAGEIPADAFDHAPEKLYAKLQP